MSVLASSTPDTHQVVPRAIAVLERTLGDDLPQILDEGRGVTRQELVWLALDEIDMKSPKRVHDLPDGGWRFSRPSAGFRATVVAGTPTVLDGKPTGEMPANVGHARLSSGG